MEFSYNIKTKNLLNETIQSIEDISNGLNYNNKKEASFHQLLQDLCSIYEEGPFKLYINHPENLTSSPYLQNQFYRITQELLNNAVTHSKAKNVYINFYYNTENF